MPHNGLRRGGLRFSHGQGNKAWQWRVLAVIVRAGRRKLDQFRSGEISEHLMQNAATTGVSADGRVGLVEETP
jgi:hypothetical protein